MKFSNRIQQVKPSMTLAIDAKAKQLKAQGEDVIGFGAGEPDFNTPDRIKQAGVRAIEENDTHYTPVGGSNDLKDAIITKLKRDNGLSYERDQILASCGAKQSFYNLAQVLWDQGDEVIIPAPYWVSFPEMVVLAGAKPVIIETDSANEFKITVDQIKEVLTPNTRAILINSPSNPTGSAYEKEELEAIDLDDSFEQMIEDCYGTEVQIGFIKSDVSTAIKNLDPIAWDVAKGEYLDSLIEDVSIVEAGNGYYWKHELEAFLS